MKIISDDQSVSAEAVRAFARRHPRDRLGVICLLAFCSLLWMPGQAGAQNIRIVASDNALEIPELNLVLPLPEGILAEQTPSGSNSVARIRPRRMEPETDWTLGVQITTNRGGVNPTIAADAAIEALRLSYAEIASKLTGRELRESITDIRLDVISREPDLLISDLPAYRFYVSAPGPIGGDSLRGYTIIQISPTQLVTFELVASSRSRDTARPMAETIIASAKFGDPMEAMAERGRLVGRGAALLTALTPEDWEEVIRANPQRWERLYRPSRTGLDQDAEEIGYRVFSLERGERGPDKGYWLRVRARMLEGDLVMDTDASFFVSEDYRFEQWTIRQTHRDRGLPAGTFRERGLRDGLRIRVFVEGEGQPARTIHPVIRGEGYISRLEAQLLPILLHRIGVESDFGFYSYSSTDERIRLRQDTFEFPNGRDAPSRVTSVLAEGTLPQFTVLRPDGSVLRIVRPDGAVWEPAPLERIAALWRSKGLPMD